MTAPQVDEDGLCVCCQLDPSSCGKAAEQRQQAEHRERVLELLRLPGAFPAQYPGTCAVGGEPFAEGDPIVRSSVGAVGYCALLCCGP